MSNDSELSSTNFRTKFHFDLKTFDPVDDYLNHLANTLGRISREEINDVVEVLFKAWKARKQVFVFGNGGSAATASHMTNDLCKLTAVDGKPRLKAICLADNIPLITAWSNDKEYEQVFAEQLINFIAPGDVVIAISTSGNSPNVLRALEVAAAHGAVRIGLTGLDGGQLKYMVDHYISIPDEHLGRQEDGHLILDHVIANTLRWMIEGDVE